MRWREAIIRLSAEAQEAVGVGAEWLGQVLAGFAEPLSEESLAYREALRQNDALAAEAALAAEVRAEYERVSRLYERLSKTHAETETHLKETQVRLLSAQRLLRLAVETGKVEEEWLRAQR